MAEDDEPDIDGDEIDENDAGVDLTRARHARIARALKSLNAVRQEIADENPDVTVNWFLDASDNLMLMARPHDVLDQDPRFAVYEGQLKVSSCGDW